MSVPPPYSQRSTSSGEVMEDCRDYLRTGRCKYGSSCKYFHPLNVASGGGMKAPANPSEPMFPVRPNEPICQYYIKHGTCKFGQACKFNHPPQPPLQAVVNGRGTVMMNLGRPPTEVPHQLVLNPVGTDSNGSMMLQFLPQRPDEPDCIYFLKNGRCKYGATCRYHHPINYLQQRRVDDSARRNRIPNQDPYRVQNVQYVGQLVPTSYAHSQTQVSDGPVTVLNLDATSISQGFHPLPIVSSSDGTTSYAVPITDQGSSTSSIASSYDTAVSNLDHGLGDSVGHWNRARRNGSGNSLNAYVTTDSSLQARVSSMPVLHSSASDGNIARRHRSPSYGSASEASYYDSNTCTTASMSRNTSVGSWRNEHSSPADHSRRVPSSQYAARSDGMPASRGVSIDYVQAHANARARVPVSASGGRPRRNSRRGLGSGPGDEGFTMMTSALLNMLDTPEEVCASYDEDDPRLLYATYPSAHEEMDPVFFEKLSLNESHQFDSGSHPSLEGSVDPSWCPNSAPPPAGRPTSDDEAIQVMQHHHANGPPSHAHSGNNVGLYLP